MRTQWIPLFLREGAGLGTDEAKFLHTVHATRMRKSIPNMNFEH